MDLEQAAQEAEEKKKMIESARPKVEQREIQRQRKLDAMRSKQVQRHLISRVLLTLVSIGSIPCTRGEASGNVEQIGGAGSS